MQFIIISELIGVTPNTDAGLVAEELHMAVVNQPTPEYPVLVGYRKQAKSSAMPQHQDGVISTDGTLYRAVGVRFGDMHRDILPLLI